VIPGDLPASFVWAYLFCIGACVGSFLNVCVYRLPRREDVWGAWRGVVSPPSACPRCSTRIQARDNIPIFGWLILRGRCRSCQLRISWRYPVIELLNGLLFVGLYIAIVPAGYHVQVTDSAVVTADHPLFHFAHHSAVVWRLHLLYLYYLIFVEALLVASLIDFDLQIIPDSVTLPAGIVGVLGSLFGTMWLQPVWQQSPELVTLLWGLNASELSSPPWWTQVTVPAWCLAYPQWHALSISLVGALVGGGIIWFVRIAGAWVLRREAMGFGDVTLMAMIGAFLGWQPTLIVFFLAPLCALVVVGLTWLFRRPREIPFGPYLSLGAILVIFCWKPLHAASERFFALGPYVPLLAVVMGVLLVVVLWLVQGLKWLLGIAIYDDEFVGEWTSADQLSFFAAYQATQAQQTLPKPQWPGTAASQGTLQRQRWLGR
jgi:leader peptidase (prepilin peptidase) / N-methyltransferase